MLKVIKAKRYWVLMAICVISLAACQGATQPVSTSVVESTMVTQPAETTPAAEPVSESTPTAAESSDPRILVYCTLADPGSLYIYGYTDGLLWREEILEAIYDGPIDNRGFAFQPVILEKLPSLGDGDAQLNTVEVTVGDRVVDAAGNPVALEPGVRVRPSGCQVDDCAVEFNGSQGLEMDQLVVTFKLLPGLTWSDGAPLTAADSVYSFNLAADPDTPDIQGVANKIDIQRTSSYTATDDLSVEWVGLPGNLDSTYFINFWSPLPEHLWGEFSPAELLSAEVSTQKPIGWGPYVITERISGERIMFEKNADYFRAYEGLPRFDRLVFRFVGENVGAQIASLLSGECDILSRGAMAIELQSDQGEQLFQLSASGRINTAFTTGSRWEHIDFGIQPASYDDGWQPGDRPDFFGDVRTRRAFALCMDRQRMLDVSYFGRSFVADSYLSPQHPLYNPDVRHYDFDPATGSALLEEVGWEMGPDGVRFFAGEHPRIPPGTQLSVRYDTQRRINREAVQVMADSLAECGVEVDVTYWDPADFFADGPEGLVFGRNFDLTQFRWWTGASPPCDLYLSDHIPGEETTVFPLGWLGQNNPGFSDPEYDQACWAAQQALPGQLGYTQNHLKAQEIFAEQLPVVPLFFNTNLVATRPDFCGQILDPSENQDTWNIEAFDYGSDC